MIGTYTSYENKFAQLRNYVVSVEDDKNMCLRYVRIYNVLSARKADELGHAIREHLQNLLDDGISLETYTYESMQPTNCEAPGDASRCLVCCPL